MLSLLGLMARSPAQTRISVDIVLAAFAERFPRDPAPTRREVASTIATADRKGYIKIDQEDLRRMALSANNPN